MDEELHEALIAWQGGELPAGRAESLLSRLRTDASFRQALAEQVWTLSLTRVAQAPDPRWLALHEELGLESPSSGRMPADTFEGAVMQSLQQEKVRYVPAWWRLAALCSVAASVVLAAGVTSWGLRAPRLAAAAKSLEKPMLAVLVQAENAVWQTEKPSPFPQGSAVSAGRLQLLSGRATLLFTSGVLLDVEGPADLDLLTVDRLLCRTGRLRSHVPPGAEGFCIETPGGAITDLGTEIGVSISADGKTHVAVFEGEAELSTPIPGQEGVRTALLGKEGTAALVPGTGQILPSSEASFLPGTQVELPALPLPAGYAETILAARPTYYWRMRRSEGTSLPNEVPQGPSLQLAGATRIETDAYGAPSVLFNGKTAPGSLHLLEPWARSADGWAVEFWFASDSVDLASLVALTAPNSRRRHLFLVETGGRRPGHGAEAGVVRYLTRWPADHRGGMNLYSASPAFPYQWHHLVAQQRGRELQLYLDGKLAGTAQTDETPEPLPCVLQFGCLEHPPGEDPTLFQRPFSGRLAEVALYDRLLTAGEIAKHAGSRE